ncbi:MAG TPA: cation-translocating P-type ATPase [Verrucomicrobiae bacterium]|nr:cation-translocating P-type ATPase [Verrucomicrobiae bacterium]
MALSGMTCGNCARHVTEALQGVAGVHSASVSLDTSAASVRWESAAAENANALIAAVHEAGYGASVSDSSTVEPAGRKLAGWRLNLWVGVLGTAPLMIGEWAFRLGMVRWFQWASFVLAAVVQVIAGAPFYRGAWGQLKARASNMDTLVALGSTTAFVYSAWAFLSGVAGHLYFMEAAGIITLISLGHWTEARMSSRASGALRELMDLAPTTARKLAPGGDEISVPVAGLQPGDLIALRPGDRIPTDAVVVEGASAVNEAMLTGESLPVEKAAQAEVYAGTVNLNGRLVARVQSTGEETALAHVIAAVQRAQTSRANIQRLGDRVSNVFVPVVVTVALAAGLWWGFGHQSALRVSQWLAHWLWTPQAPAATAAAGFIIAAAVLIVACPCAMGLATPAAIMAASNAASRRGILIRDGIALEKAGHVTTVLFDKTGTLTTGDLKVEKVWTREIESDEAQAGREARERRMVALAASLARHSTHPLSRAVAALTTEGRDVTNWSEVRGAGVQAAAANGLEGPVRLGSARWMEESGVSLAAGVAFIEQWAAEGASVLALSEGTELLGLFAVRDTLKSGAVEVIHELTRAGMKVCMITGDNARTAKTMAKLAGISPDLVFADTRPEEKAELLKELQRRGERVAFVGDGINDSPAMEQADLGIAVSRASDVAREAADIILLSSDIEAVPESIALARATLRVIKQNLFWAFFYNAAGVPLAALGFLNPILCAAAMGFSDLIVIGNALRLRKVRSTPR